MGRKAKSQSLASSNEIIEIEESTMNLRGFVEESDLPASEKQHLLSQLEMIGMMGVMETKLMEKDDELTQTINERRKEQREQILNSHDYKNREKIRAKKNATADAKANATAKFFGHIELLQTRANNGEALSGSTAKLLQLTGGGDD